MAGPLLLYLAAASLLYGVYKLVRQRLFYRNLPKPPHSFFWGHLKLFGEVSQLFPPNVHPQLVATYMQKRYNLPEVFYIDLWPFAESLMICCSPDAAAQITQVQSLGKHSEAAVFLDPLLGTDSIPTVNGPLWKTVYHMLQPAFRPANVRALVGIAAEEGRFFARDVLASLAETGEVFSMQSAVSSLIFEVIVRSLLGMPFDAQRHGGLRGPLISSDETEKSGGCGYGDGKKGPPSIIRDIQLPAHNWQKERTVARWNPLLRLRLAAERKAALRRSGDWLRRLILQRYDAVRDQDIRAPESVLDSCLIERVELERSGAVRTRVPDDAAWQRLFINNMRAIVFGAQGTTTDVVCYAYMLLSIYPEVMRRMREEHDAVCGPALDGAVQLLQEQPNRVRELHYTTAVLKETMRLFPIGFTVRHDDKSTDGHIVINGRRYPTRGQMICPSGHTIHHDPAVFADPLSFLPDRWLVAEVPRNAFRTFELGPRSCMGREVAMDEMRAIMLVTARWFDFEVADPPAPGSAPRVPLVSTLDAAGLGINAFQELGMEAMPRDGAIMRVRRTQKPF